jgi:hypothetical protein
MYNNNNIEKMKKIISKCIEKLDQTTYRMDQGPHADDRSWTNSKVKVKILHALEICKDKDKKRLTSLLKCNLRPGTKIKATAFETEH